MTILDTVKMLVYSTKELAITCNAILEAGFLIGVDLYDVPIMARVSDIKDDPQIDYKSFERIISIHRYLNSIL